MASDIQIVNNALDKLGEQPIGSFADQSVPARLANRSYVDLRDALLREFPWNFAIKRVALAADVTAPTWGFARAFTLPSDNLRLIELDNEDDYDWRNEDGKILTDHSAPLNIRYVASVTEGKMDATFRECLSARLAMEWAEPLSQTTSKGEQMAARCKNKLQVARTADGQTGRVRTLAAQDFLDVRY